MDNLVSDAIQSTIMGTDCYVKFLSANDTGKNNAHQCGVLISKKAKSMIFDVDLPSTGIIDRWVDIRWLNLGIVSNSRFIYYSSKHELRVTNFSKGFPFLRPEETGSLFILIRKSASQYDAAIISDGDDISDFLAYFGVTPNETNDLLPHINRSASDIIEDMIDEYYRVTNNFPSSEKLSELGRDLAGNLYPRKISATKDPDRTLVLWTNNEYNLFRAFEKRDIDIKGGIQNLLNGDLDTYQLNSILNRRKSRAGKSLENQLQYLFMENGLPFTSQATTEEKKRPDFIFPSESAYHDPTYPSSKLISLAAKTTCKDRWRQVITEADRTEIKYLCTLQKGISSYQLQEMADDKVVLVVPKENFQSFPTDKRHSLLSVRQFIDKVKETYCLG